MEEAGEFGAPIASFEAFEVGLDSPLPTLCVGQVPHPHFHLRPHLEVGLQEDHQETHPENSPS